MFTCVGVWVRVCVRGVCVCVCVFVSNLRNSYNLWITDGQTNYVYAEEEMKKIFVRPRSTTALHLV